MSGETSSIESGASYRLPSDGALRSAAKISCSEDKPIMLDYWTLSLDGKIIIGVKESGEKMLVKSAEEYTSMIQKIYKVESVRKDEKSDVGQFYKLYFHICFSHGRQFSLML